MVILTQLANLYYGRPARLGWRLFAWGQRARGRLLNLPLRPLAGLWPKSPEKRDAIGLLQLRLAWEYYESHETAEAKFMFGKKKKRVVCPILVLVDLMQTINDDDSGTIEIRFLFYGVEHVVGFSCDYEERRGFFDYQYYMDNQVFDSFEKFKADAVLCGKPFFSREDAVEVVETDRGDSKPWDYPALSRYVVEK